MVFKHAVPILFSSDVQKSIDYYTRVLGFATQWTWDDPPTFGGVGKDLVEIFFCKDGQGNRGTWIAIMVDNIDTFYEQAKSNGAIIRSAPENREWGLREMLVEDPDGHMIRFGQHIGHDRHKSTGLPDALRIIDRSPTLNEYKDLVSAVRWQVKDDDVTKKALSSAIFAAVAEDPLTGRIVGCVLLLGDHASFYYIKDMMVDPEWQSRHVGTALMERINQWLDQNAVEGALVGLYTGENLAPFYRQFGFRENFGMTRRIAEKAK